MMRTFVTFQHLSLAAVLAAGLTASAGAAEIGYWQFDDQAAGVNASTLVSQTSSPDLDGTASANFDTVPGNLPIHSAERPGGLITDGLGGPAINPYNTSSLEFIHAGDVNTKAGGVVTVQDPGASTLLEPAGDFTIEGFVKIDAHVNFATLVGKDRSGGTSWVIDTNSNGTLRMRADTQDGVSPGLFNDGLTSSFNLEDGQWHHFAMTYLASERRVTLYGDYNPVATKILSSNGTIQYDDGALRIGDLSGGRAIDGWLDEIRYSTSVLTTSQFLVATVPAPAALPAGLALLSFAAMRRRRA